MLRLLSLFVFIPIQRYYINNEVIENFSHLSPILLLIPKMFKHNEICEKDDDCPLVMRCCQIGEKKYCCTPNNFVKIDLAYQHEEIKEFIE